MRPLTKVGLLVPSIIFCWTASLSGYAQKLPGTMEHNAEIISAQFSNNNELVITASADGIVKLWDAKSGKLIRPLGIAQPISKIFKAELSPDGEFVATVSGRGGKVWSTKFGDQAFPITGHRDTITALQFSTNSKWLVTAATDGTVRVWETQSGKRHHALNHMIETLQKKGSSGVTEARFCNKNKWIITGSNRLTARDSGAVINSSQGKLRYDSTLVTWDMHSGKVVRTFVGYPVSMNEEGTHLVSGSANTIERCFRVWDISGATGGHSFENRQGRITGCEFSRDGKWILTSSSEDGSCRLLHASTFKPAIILAIGTANTLNEAHFSPDGKLVASFSERSAKIWEVATGNLVREIQSDKPIVFSHDSKRMVVITEKKALQYEVHSGTPVAFAKDADAQKTVKTVKQR